MKEILNFFLPLSKNEKELSHKCIPAFRIRGLERQFSVQMVHWTSLFKKSK